MPPSLSRIPSHDAYPGPVSFLTLFCKPPFWREHSPFCKRQTHRWFQSNFRRLWGAIAQGAGTTNDYIFGANAPVAAPLWFVAISQSQGLISDPVVTAIQ